MHFTPGVHAPARGPRARQHGQALVEFATILPIMLFLLLVAIDFGRIFATYIALTNAAKEGTMYAIQHAPDASSGWAVTKTVARQEATDPTVSITITTASGTVTVNASEPFNFFTPFISRGLPPLWGGFGGPLTIRASASGESL